MVLISSVEACSTNDEGATTKATELCEYRAIRPIEKLKICGHFKGEFLPGWLLVLFLSFSSASFAQDLEPVRFAEALRQIQLGRLDQASTSLKKLVVANPEKNIYWFNLGTVEAMRGNHEYAVRVFGRVVVKKSPLAPAAQLYISKSLRALGRADEARTVLEELLQMNLPANLQAEVAKDIGELAGADPEAAALEAYRNGDLDGAEELLSRLGIETLSADGALLYGLVLYKNGKANRANEVFQSVLRNPALSSDKKNITNDLLKKIKTTPEAFPYWTVLDATVGHTSNAFSDGRSVNGVSSLLGRTSVAAGYHFLKGQSVSFKAGYLVNYEEPFAARELRTLSQTVQTPLIWEKSLFSGSLIPYLQWQAWAGNLVSEKMGLGFKLSWTRQKLDVGTDGDFSAMRSMSSSYSYLQGSSYSIKPYLGYFGQNLYAQVFYSYGSDGTQDIVYSDSSRLPLQHTFQGPGMKLIWRVAENSAAFLNMSQLEKNFKNTSLPVGKARFDRELALSLKFSYWLMPKVSVYGLGEWTSNSSTLGATDVRDKNYEILVFVAGLNWDVF